MTLLAILVAVVATYVGYVLYYGIGCLYYICRRKYSESLLAHLRFDEAVHKEAVRIHQRFVEQMLEELRAQQIERARQAD